MAVPENPSKVSFQQLSEVTVLNGFLSVIICSIPAHRFVEACGNCSRVDPTSIDPSARKGWSTIDTGFRLFAL